MGNELDSGPVCGSDGRTYPSSCSLRQQSCKMMRRQGRSFQSSLLKIEQVHSGGCKSSCDGMEDLGAFKAFNLRATNNGLCIHDFFQCARKMRKLGRKKSREEQKKHPKLPSLEGKVANADKMANLLCHFLLPFL